MLQYLNLRCCESICSDAENLSSEPYPRRTISIAPKINRMIQELRATFLRTYPEQDIDYTTVANFIMAWGIVGMQKYSADADDFKSIDSLLGSSKQLKAQGILDLYESLAKENITK